MWLLSQIIRMILGMDDYGITGRRARRIGMLILGLISVVSPRALAAGITDRIHEVQCTTANQMATVENGEPTLPRLQVLSLPSGGCTVKASNP